MTNFYSDRKNKHIIILTAVMMFLSASIYAGNPTKELRIAAKQGDVEKIKLLLESGADINAAGGTKNRTALHVAAKKGQLKVVEYLLSAKADADPVGKKGATPLILAAKNGHTGVVQALLAHGADKTIKNKNGKSAVDMAINAGNSDIRELLKHQDLAISTNITLDSSVKDTQNVFQDSATRALNARGWSITGNQSDRIDAQLIKNKRIYKVAVELIKNRITINYQPYYGSHKLNYLLNIRKDINHILSNNS